ncbi:MAG: hypothetical protein M9894_22120 [Planctomycetes bacterium]|nr:hypothetical protein [Planctomycetota bacterium]
MRRAELVLAILCLVGAPAAAQDPLTPLPPEAFEGLCPPEEHPRAEDHPVDEVRALLAAGDVAALEARLAERRAAGTGAGDLVSRFDHVLDGLTARGVPLAPFDAWCAARPEDGLPFLARGMRRITAAWEARGTGVAATVPEAGWRGFREHLEGAATDLERARALLPDDPRPAANLITVAMGQGWPVERTRALFDEATRRDPRCFDAYNAMTTYLLPRWHGSPQAVLTFALEQLEARPDEPALYLLLNVALQEQGRGRLREDERARLHERLRQGLARLVDTYPAWTAGVRPVMELARASGDRALDAACVRALAGAGAAGYQQRLGEMLAGVRPGYLEPDPAEAARWFCRAAVQGRQAAAVNLAGALIAGKGVARDEAQGFLWLLRAAELGHPHGMRHVGSSLLVGRGCAPDVERGRAWLERAAEAGDAPAMRNLAMSFLDTRFGERDLARGRAWLERAVEEADGLAMMHLGGMLTRGPEEVRDLPGGVALLRRALAAGVAAAAEDLREALSRAPELRRPGDPE